ncbi:MAG TPA: response regulator [Candidatus Baltobacteraceae bacterium]|nr:response regulator [Candidatus Baltobacteraceae bacterium]
MSSSVPDLATLPASTQQRRIVLIAVAVLGVVALAALPFAENVLSPFSGFVTLYGGAVLMGLAITTTILYGQFTLSRTPALLALACGALFSTIAFIPYVLSFAAGAGSLPAQRFSVASSFLWVLWHTAFPASFVIYAALARFGKERRIGAGTATFASAVVIVAAYLSIHFIVAYQRLLPELTHDGGYTPGVYLALAAGAVLAAAALVLLTAGRRPTVIDLWLSVPAAALLAEALLNGLGHSRYSVGWYLSRIDVLVATTFLVIALLLETNRLSRFLADGERRLRGIVDGVADALIAVDARGAVASVNPAAVALFGFGAGDLPGTAISRLLPDYASVAAADDARVVETTARHAGGALFPVELVRGRDATRLGETSIIVRDITHRKRAEEAIRAAHDRAVEAAEVKSQFLATMSHEIRTPINAVVGMSELLLQTPLGDEAKEYAITVRDSAESLLAIVNDILDFSKIEAGRMELDSTPFGPVVAVENATDMLAAAARKKGLSLSTYVAPDVPRRVLGDADRLRQVLLNLIGNAVKFTAAGSVTVRAVVERTEGERTSVVRFSVSDTGPGIAPDVAAHLFEPFRQADQSTRRRFGGTGLGLSISRRIVELMGGKIGFDSSAGRGATFWFTVPFERVEDAPREHGPALHGARVLVVDEDSVARQVVDQYLLSWGAVASSTANAAHGLELARAAAARGGPFDAIVIDRHAGGDAPAYAARLRAVLAAPAPIVVVSGSDEPLSESLTRSFSAVVRKPIRQGALYEALASALRGAASDPTPPTNGNGLAHASTEVHDAAERGALVLVAEDNPVNRKLALKQLKKLGYAAYAVSDGREAVDALAHGRYDVVLMDCQMPEMDGFEATREIRRREAERGGHIPIVAMTANALEGDREACLAAGMDDYLAKPVQLSELRAAVERFTNGVHVAG